MAAGARAQEGNHSDSNNILPLISLISSFLWLKVYYSGKSAAVVFAQDETLAARVRMERRTGSTKRGPRDAFPFSTYTYFCPVVVRVGLRYHLHLETQRKRKERIGDRSDRSLLSNT